MIWRILVHSIERYSR